MKKESVKKRELLYTSKNILTFISIYLGPSDCFSK